MQLGRVFNFGWGRAERAVRMFSRETEWTALVAARVFCSGTGGPVWKGVSVWE